MKQNELERLMAVVDELEAGAEVLTKESRRLPLQARFMAGISSGMAAAAGMLLQALNDLDENDSQRLSVEAIESMYQYYNMVEMEDAFRE